MKWAPNNYRSPETVRQRQEWISAMEGGKNPFDSKALEELRKRQVVDPYLLELLRYIHLNPVRAGIVKDMETLDRYPRTGHAV